MSLVHVCCSYPLNISTAVLYLRVMLRIMLRMLIVKWEFWFENPDASFKIHVRLRWYYAQISNMWPTHVRANHGANVWPRIVDECVLTFRWILNFSVMGVTNIFNWFWLVPLYFICNWQIMCSFRFVLICTAKYTQNQYELLSSHFQLLWI